MKAVLVIELDLPDDQEGALMDAASSVGEVEHAIHMHAAIYESAARVLDVFANQP